MTSISQTNSGAGAPSVAETFFNKFALPRERLEAITQCFQRSQADSAWSSFSDGQLQAFCFKQVVQACKDACHSKNFGVLQSLSERVVGLLDGSGRSVYQAVIEECEGSIITQLLAKSELLPPLQNGDNAFALHFAARKNRADLIHVLTTQVGKAGFNEVNSEGKTPMHVAIEYGSKKFVEALLKQPVALYFCFKEQSTGFFLSSISFAVWVGEMACFDLLAAKEKDTWFQERVDGVGNLFHLAVVSGQTAVLEYLLDKYPKETHLLVNGKNSLGLTPLSLAASYGDLESMAVLAAHGADLESTDRAQQTALHHAVLAKQKEAVLCLLCLGANPDPKDMHMKSPVLYAQEKDLLSRDIAQLLLNVESLRKELKEAPPNFHEEPPENLVFQGGGPKGIAYIGALRALSEKGILPLVKRFAGTSAGAITALLMAIGYSVEEASQHLMGMQMLDFLDYQGSKSSLLDSLSFSSLKLKNIGEYIRICQHLRNHSGLCKGEAFRLWIAEAIKQKTEDENLTFGELRKLVELGKCKHLYVFATKIGANAEITQFSSEDSQWDTLIVADAVRASMSIPGVFEAHTLHCKSLGHRSPQEAMGSYADGGMLYNLPIEAFDKKKFVERGKLSAEEGNCPVFNKRTLAFSLYTPGEEFPQKETPVASGKSVIAGVVKTYLRAEDLTRNKVTYNKYRVIKISNVGVGTLEFDLTPEKMKQLVASGEGAVQSFFEEKRTLFSQRIGTMLPSKNAKEACERGDIAYLKKALDKLATGKDKLVNRIEEGRPLIVIGAEMQQPAVVRFLLANGAASELRDAYGYQAIHYAAKNGDESLVQALMAPITRDAKGEYGRTPLHMAAFQGKASVVRCLIEGGANINALTEDSGNKTTPLHEAVLQNHLPVVQELVRSPNLDVNLRDRRNFTPLYYAVSDGLVEVIPLILHHVSFVVGKPEDPNHISRLLELRCRQNQEEVRALLAAFS